MDKNQENESEVFLIVGLGNPGTEYRQTRHNFGFQALEAFADSHQISLKKAKFKAILGEGKSFGKKVILAKPLTYMNESGSAVSALLHYFKLDLEQMLVIHDDLDLPLGTLRLRPEGGTSGQRGMASIIAKLGTQSFPRLRLGIGRPPGQMDPADYVLQRFSKSEEELQKIVLKTSVEAIDCFIQHGLVTAMNRYNGEAG